MEKVTNAIATLFDILELSGVKITFSKNCRSGLLPKDTCQCWRCRQERGEPVTEESEQIAARAAVEADLKFKEKMRNLYAPFRSS